MIKEGSEHLPIVKIPNDSITAVVQKAWDFDNWREAMAEF